MIEIGKMAEKITKNLALFCSIIGVFQLILVEGI